MKQKVRERRQVLETLYTSTSVIFPLWNVYKLVKSCASLTYEWPHLWQGPIELSCDSFQNYPWIFPTLISICSGFCWSKTRQYVWVTYLRTCITSSHFTFSRSLLQAPWNSGAFIPPSLLSPCSQAAGPAPPEPGELHRHWQGQRRNARWGANANATALL